MFGFYDPESLFIEKDKGRIQFINARDADDIHIVEIETPDDAMRIRSALDAQKTLQIATLGADIEQRSGLIIMNEGNSREGVIQSENREIIPFMLDFDIPDGVIPGRTRGTALGYRHDGALVVDRIAVMTKSPAPKPAPQSRKKPVEPVEQDGASPPVTQNESQD